MLHYILLPDIIIIRGIVEGVQGAQPLFLRDLGVGPLHRAPFRLDKFITTHLSKEKKGKVCRYQ